MAGIASGSVAGVSIAALQIAAVGSQTTGYVETFTPGVSASASYSWSPPKAGNWKFVLWGAGDGSNSAGSQGASAAYAEKTVFLSVKDVVAISVAVGRGNNAGLSTTITLPSGLVVTAGGGNGATGGTATNGDLNLNGSAPGSDGLGTAGGLSGDATTAGAPGQMPFRGGNGGFNGGGGAANGGTPGGGGVGGPGFFAGGHGQVIVSFVKP